MNVKQESQIALRSEYRFRRFLIGIGGMGNPGKSSICRRKYAILTLCQADNPAGIESRSGGVNNDYQIVLTFATPVTYASAAVSTGTGSVAASSGSGTTTITIDLTGVISQQTITVALFNVNDGTNSGDTGVRMSVLVGDTNASGSVGAADIAQTKSQSGVPVDGSNFREDVTTNGSIGAADIVLVKSKSGNVLPPP